MKTVFRFTVRYQKKKVKKKERNEINVNVNHYKNYNFFFLLLLSLSSHVKTRRNHLGFIIEREKKKTLLKKMKQIIDFSINKN